MAGTSRWPVSSDGARGDDYDRRFAQKAAAGEEVHGEAGFVEALDVRRVLDAGCGTGRVAIELDRRGLEVVGVDLDPKMLATARRKAPHLEWRRADLASLELGQRFDAAVMAGNVMIFVAPGTEGRVLHRLAAHLRPGGLVVAGFRLLPDRLDLVAYDDLALAAGLVLEERFATWDRRPFTAGGDYAVSVHRLDAAGD